MKRFFVYMLATRKDGPLYIGVTNDLRRRVYEHKARIIRGFTYKYNIDRPVWFEAHDTAEGAITKEKQMKRWHRAWKIELIQKTNPDWQDISEEL